MRAPDSNHPRAARAALPASPWATTAAQAAAKAAAGSTAEAGALRDVDSAERDAATRRASRPAARPARTSPEPAVPRPLSMPSQTASSPLGRSDPGHLGFQDYHGVEGFGGRRQESRGVRERALGSDVGQRGELAGMGRQDDRGGCRETRVRELAKQAYRVGIEDGGQARAEEGRQVFSARVAPAPARADEECVPSSRIEGSFFRLGLDHHRLEHGGGARVERAGREEGGDPGAGREAGPGGEDGRTARAHRTREDGRPPALAFVSGIGRRRRQARQIAGGKEAGGRGDGRILRKYAFDGNDLAGGGAGGREIQARFSRLDREGPGRPDQREAFLEGVREARRQVDRSYGRSSAKDAREEGRALRAACPISRCR